MILTMTMTMMIMTYGQMAGEVPIEGFARVANPSGHLLLAVAQLS